MCGGGLADVLGGADQMKRNVGKGGVERSRKVSSPERQ